MDNAKRKHWQVVENVVAAIERATAGIPNVVLQKAAVEERLDPNETREVDVLIEGPVGARRMRVGVEVKDEARPLDVTTVEGLSRKKAKLRLDRLCVVSTSGYTEKARKEAQEQGIELSTIEQFERSDWWLAAPIQEVRRNQVELVQATFGWATDEDRAQWLKAGTVQVDEVQLSDAGGSSAPLSSWLVGYGILALEQPGAADLVDGSEYRVRISMSGPSLVFGCRGDVLPCPATIDARYRLHRATEHVPEMRFRTSDGIEAFTVQIPDLLGEDRQATIVAVPEPDGSRQLKLSIGPSRPPRGARS